MKTILFVLSTNKVLIRVFFFHAYSPSCVCFMVLHAAGKNGVISNFFFGTAVVREVKNSFRCLSRRSWFQR
jgi:hypothetical protein